MKPDEFLRIGELSENADRRLELVAGALVEKAPDYFIAVIGARLTAQIGDYVQAHNLGFVTGADGGYRVIDSEYYVPNAAFLSRETQNTPSRELYNSTPPSLAIEIIAPTDDPDVLRIKIANYLSAGTVVWLVNPDKQQVEVYAPGEPAQKIGVQGTLNGGDVLPGFQLDVRLVFPDA